MSAQVCVGRFIPKRSTQVEGTQTQSEGGILFLTDLRSMKSDDIDAVHADAVEPIGPRASYPSPQRGSSELVTVPGPGLSQLPSRAIPCKATNSETREGE